MIGFNRNGHRKVERIVGFKSIIVIEKIQNKS